MPFFGSHAGAAGQAVTGIPVDITFLDVDAINSSLTTFNHSVDLGNPGFDRLVTVGVGGLGSSSPITISSVTIAGVSATIHTQGNIAYAPGFGNAVVGGIASAVIPAATTGSQTVSVVYSAGLFDATCGAWQVLNANTTPLDAQTDTANALSAGPTLNCVADGGLIGHGSLQAQSPGPVTTWTADGVDPIEDYDQASANANRWRSGCRKTPTPLDATHQLTATAASGTNPGLTISGVSFQPG